MRMRMKSTQLISEDGSNLETYQDGEVYDMSNKPKTLAIVTRENWATRVTGGPLAKKALKARGGAPSNKAKGGGGEDK